MTSKRPGNVNREHVMRGTKAVKTHKSAVSTDATFSVDTYAKTTINVQLSRVFNSWYAIKWIKIWEVSCSMNSWTSLSHNIHFRLWLNYESSQSRTKERYSNSHDDETKWAYVLTTDYRVNEKIRRRSPKFFGQQRQIGGRCNSNFSWGLASLCCVCLYILILEMTHTLMALSHLRFGLSIISVKHIWSFFCCLYKDF